MAVKSKKRKYLLYQTILHMIIVILLVLMLYPLVMAVFIAVKNASQYTSAPWVPTLPMWFSNFPVAGRSVVRYVCNTVIVATAGVGGMLFVSSISAYVFARLKFPGKEQIYFGIIALMMVPGVLTLVPQYMLYHDLGLLNSHWALIVPQIFGGSVAGVFLLRAFFGGIPEDIFEAGRIDGCGEFGNYIYVCLPLSKPILGTLTMQGIMGVWNDIVWPTITIQNSKLWTISAGLYLEFTGTYSTNVPVQFAGFLIASTPLILLFVFANKYYVEGLTSAGLKL